MVLRGFDVRREEGLVVARWTAPCGGVRCAFWNDLSVCPVTLRGTAAKIDEIDELVAACGAEPLVYVVSPCDERTRCCTCELPRLRPHEATTGVRPKAARRPSSVPPAW